MKYMHKPLLLFAVVTAASLSLTSCVGGGIPPKIARLALRFSALNCPNPSIILRTDKSYLSSFTIELLHTNSPVAGQLAPGQVYPLDLTGYAKDANGRFKIPNYDYEFSSAVFLKDNPEVFGENPKDLTVAVDLKCEGREALTFNLNAVISSVIQVEDDASTPSGLKIITLDRPPENFY